MTYGNIDDTVGLLDGGAPIVSVLIPISFGSYLHMSSVLYIYIYIKVVIIAEPDHSSVLYKYRESRLLHIMTLKKPTKEATIRHLLYLLAHPKIIPQSITMVSNG